MRTSGVILSKISVARAPCSRFARLNVRSMPAAGATSNARAGRMHHLGIGAAHARKCALSIADEHTITVSDLTTGEILSEHTIEPNKTYWYNQK